jgi:arsenate reductase
VTVRRYLEDTPTPSDIRAALDALGNPAAASIMRTSEKLFRELNLSKAMDEATLIAAMAAHPILIERPIVVVGDRAVIGRPPSRVLDLL